MYRNWFAISFLVYFTNLYTVADAWNVRGRQVLPEWRRFWQSNGNQTHDSSVQNAPKGNSPAPMFQNAASSQRGRGKRIFSLFTVVKFDNGVCGGTSGENGTCISPSECSQRGGVSSGICANGYGVCCIVTVSCSQTTSDNNTYFVNPNYPSSFDGTESCQLTLVKSHPDVCQFRLDYEQFNIRGPEKMHHVCTYDQFIVSGGNPIPTICGYNNGNHMYVDAGIGQTNPVTLTVVTSGSPFARTWKVRVSQIRCSTIYRAHEGCLQYFTGVSGQVKSFNYEPNTGLQLSNQDYSVCIRMERNFCGVQYMACSEEGQLSMTAAATAAQTMRSNAFTLTGNTQANQIASMTAAACQTDWLGIPCASNQGKPPAAAITCVDRLCGGTFNAEMQNLNASSVVSTVKPFRLIFHTDSTEAPNDVGNRGFCLNYIQQPCTTQL